MCAVLLRVPAVRTRRSPGRERRAWPRGVARLLQEVVCVRCAGALIAGRAGRHGSESPGRAL
ncbi:MAG: hypothetical protein LBE67_04760 [Kocuria palustris]|nr:hypothetical protein [Kocuria palustris]